MKYKPQSLIEFSNVHKTLLDGERERDKDVGKAVRLKVNICFVYAARCQKAVILDESKTAFLAPSHFTPPARKHFFHLFICR